MKRLFINIMMSMTICIGLIACTSAPTDEGQEEQEADDSVDVVEEDVPLTQFAEDIGFTLDAPVSKRTETESVIHVSGQIKDFSYMEWEHVWVVLDYQEDNNYEPFNYYIELEDGNFSKQLTLPYGAGEYDVSIRVPSQDSSEEGTYYDVATFLAVNLDDHIQREIEYTRYGAEYGLDIAQPDQDLNKVDGTLFIQGSVPDEHQGDIVLIEVEKDTDSQQIVFPIKDQTFQGEVPLYFGEGSHAIHVKMFNKDDDLYYDAATIYANNESHIQFAHMEPYNEYFTSGIILHEPTWSEENIQTTQAYQIKGEIDPSVTGAEDIHHIIVTMDYLDEDLEAGYVIPVEDHQFDDVVYFRFGPGDYEVKINIPDPNQGDDSMFYYRAIAKIEHHITNIADERDILPSRGIESDHPTLIEEAENITSGIQSEREKAKAIYKFVTENIAYDVQKAEDDIFNIADSALSTLQTGSGICQDYAFLATALLRAVGLEAHYVSGHAGERHAWVEVKVDDEWIEMDPTWGAGYVHEGVFYFHYNEDYFDPDPDFLAETHTREEVMY